MPRNKTGGCSICLFAVCCWFEESRHREYRLDQRLNVTDVREAGNKRISPWNTCLNATNNAYKSHVRILAGNHKWFTVFYFPSWVGWPRYKGSHRKVTLSYLGKPEQDMPVSLICRDSSTATEHVGLNTASNMPHIYANI